MTFVSNILRMPAAPSKTDKFRAINTLAFSSARKSQQVSLARDLRADLDLRTDYFPSR
jgi:hypothetical protein